MNAYLAAFWAKTQETLEAPPRKIHYFCKPCQVGWYDTDSVCWSCDQEAETGGHVSCMVPR